METFVYLLVGSLILYVVIRLVLRYQFPPDRK
jgi:hypothetical protein